MNQFKKAESGRTVLEIIAIIVLMALLIALGLWGFKKASLSAKVNTMNKDMSTAITERRYQIAQGGTGKEHKLNTKVGATDMVVKNITSGDDRGQFTILLTNLNQDTCEEMKNFNVFNYKKVLVGTTVNAQKELTDGSADNDCTSINALEFYFDGANGGNGGDGGLGGGNDPLEGLKCSAGSVVSCVYGQYKFLYDTLADGKKCYKCENCPTATCPDNCTCGTDPTTGCPTSNATSCTCSSGYTTTACVSGTNYQTGTETLADGTICYQCTSCPTVTCPTDCTCSTDLTTGCPTGNATSCTCSSGYTTATCVSGTNYQTGIETLTNGTTCYQCTTCPSSSCPSGKCCTESTDPTTGCLKQTETTCTCPADYPSASCSVGQTDQTVTLGNGTVCHKCSGTPATICIRLYKNKASNKNGQGTYAECCEDENELLTILTNTNPQGFKEGENQKYGCCPKNRTTTDKKCCTAAEEATSEGCCTSEKVYIENGIKKCCPGTLSEDKTYCCPSTCGKCAICSSTKKRCDSSDMLGKACGQCSTCQYIGSGFYKQLSCKSNMRIGIAHELNNWGQCISFAEYYCPPQELTDSCLPESKRCGECYKEEGNKCVKDDKDRGCLLDNGTFGGKRLGCCKNGKCTECPQCTSCG